MRTSPPPSSRSQLIRAPEVVEAGGKLRDTLGGLRNLEQLLRSMRVGPKGLERALPDVHSACEPATEAARALLLRLREALPDVAARAELEAFLLTRMAVITSALEAAMGRPMNAKNRLSLEQALLTALPELDAASELLALLGEAVWGRSLPSPFSDVLAAGHSPEHASRTLVRATLLSDFSGVEVDLPPAVAHTALCILIADFQARAGGPAGLRLSETKGGALLELLTSEAPGEVVTFPARTLIAPSTRVAAASLTARGCQVTLGDESRVFLPSGVTRARSAP